MSVRLYFYGYLRSRALQLSPNRPYMDTIALELGITYKFGLRVHNSGGTAGAIIRSLDELYECGAAVIIRIEDLDLSSEVLFLVDDWNLWVHETQQRECQFRIDTGEMIRRLMKGRPVREIILFGSVSLSTDSLWEQHPRPSMITQRAQEGRLPSDSSIRKRLVGALGAAVEGHAISASREERKLTIIVVSGNASYLAPIQKALSCEGLSVEMCAWDTSLARCYRTLATTNSKFSLVALDQFRTDSITVIQRLEQKREYELNTEKSAVIQFSGNIVVVLEKLQIAVGALLSSPVSLLTSNEFPQCVFIHADEVLQDSALRAMRYICCVRASNAQVSRLSEFLQLPATTGRCLLSGVFELRHEKGIVPFQSISLGGYPLIGDDAWVEEELSEFHHESITDVTESDSRPCVAPIIVLDHAKPELVSPTECVGAAAIAVKGTLSEKQQQCLMDILKEHGFWVSKTYDWGAFLSGPASLFLSEFGFAPAYLHHAPVPSKFASPPWFSDLQKLVPAIHLSHEVIEC